MIPYLGDFVEDDTVVVMFNTFTSDDPSASVTIGAFINTDVHIYKDGGLTQRQNAAGITVDVDVDTFVGVHSIIIDTSDDTVGGFWVTGSDYHVVIEGTTVDGATINAVVAHFSIQNRYMRGTDSAALASVCTEARLAELDAANLPADIDAIPTTAMRGTDSAALASVCTEARLQTLTDWINGGRLDLLLDAIKVVTDNLAAAATTMIEGTVSHDNTAASTTVFYSSDLTEATADHYNGRVVLFTSGVLVGQATDITDYALDTGEGKFTVTALTEAPADNVTFVIV